MVDKLLIHSFCLTKILTHNGSDSLQFEVNSLNFLQNKRFCPRQTLIVGAGLAEPAQMFNFICLFLL